MFQTDYLILVFSDLFLVFDSFRAVVIRLVLRLGLLRGLIIAAAREVSVLDVLDQQTVKILALERNVLIEHVFIELEVHFRKVVLEEGIVVHGERSAILRVKFLSTSIFPVHISVELALRRVPQPHDSLLGLHPFEDFLDDHFSVQIGEVVDHLELLGTDLILLIALLQQRNAVVEAITEVGLMIVNILDEALEEGQIRQLLVLELILRARELFLTEIAQMLEHLRDLGQIASVKL